MTFIYLALFFFLPQLAKFEEEEEEENNSQAKLNVWTMKVFPSFNRLRFILDRKMVETMVLVDCWPIIIRTVLPVVLFFFFSSCFTYIYDELRSPMQYALLVKLFI